MKSNKSNLFRVSYDGCSLLAEAKAIIPFNAKILENSVNGH